jgi:hypothetical protein
MSCSVKPLVPVALVVVLAGCNRQQPTPADFLGDSPVPAILRDLPPQVRSFIEQKEQHTLTLAGKLGVKPDRATLEYFRLARQGRYRAASRIYQDLRERGGKVDSSQHDPELRLPLWDPLLEVQLTLDAYAAGAGKFATAFGEAIVQSIPPGSIYFGGTDTGRSLPAAFSKSSNSGDPFFVLTQNQLTDGQHLNYLRAAFGDKINVLSNDDSQQAFQEYLADAKRRSDHDQSATNEPRQLRPGEDVKMVDGEVVVSGPVPVMAINGLLTKTLFDNNPDREFYVEESFPIDWMYPHLTPHGLIMKINRQRVAELTPAIVERDRNFWKQRQAEFIGNWLKPDTSVREVCEFVEKTFMRKDFTDFKGDINFVGNHYATAAYSKLRSSQGGLYAWRIGNSKLPQEQQLMSKEARFAFLQSFALCPSNPEAVYRQVNLLLHLGRVDDCLLIARTTAKLDPANTWSRNSIR